MFESCFTANDVDILIVVYFTVLYKCVSTPATLLNVSFYTAPRNDVYPRFLKSVLISLGKFTT